jgi:predicted DCC family thiol-disulfide oxidoreductase YuxK
MQDKAGWLVASYGEADPPALGFLMMSAPMVLLYDGDCRFCTSSAAALARRFGPARLETRDFQKEGVLAALPGVSYDACMRRMHLVFPDGRVYAGPEGFARLLATTPFVGWLAYLYYVPGIRQVAELVYALVAKHRYRVFGRTDACEDGTCHLHG